MLTVGVLYIFRPAEKQTKMGPEKLELKFKVNQFLFDF